jgi:hypothetical protein
MNMDAGYFSETRLHDATSQKIEHFTFLLQYEDQPNNALRYIPAIILGII